MEYSKIIAVTGLPGLQEIISSKTDGAIVRSLDDKSTRFVSSRIHNFSHLESIEVFTERDNVNLVEVFQAMEKSSTSLPDEKDPAAVKGYFQKVYPSLDFERVYHSDMKKMVRWFQSLKANQIEIKLTEIPEEPETVAAASPEPQPAAKEKAPAKAKAESSKEKKKEAAPTAKEVKKAPAKAKAEKEEEKKSAPAKKTAAKKK